MEWIKASEVFERAGDRASILAAHSSLAKAICKRAKAGLLEAKASRYIIGKDSPRDDFKLPADFWWAEGGFALTQDWQSGDFSTILNSSQGPAAQAFGVSFSAKDVEPLIAAYSRQSVRSPVSLQALTVPPKGKGGAPKDQGGWDSFWMAVLDLAMQERLTAAHFASQKDLRGEILAEIGDALSDRTIKPKVAQIWRKWIET